VGTKNSKNDGAILVNKSGALISLSIDDSTLVNFLMTQCPHIPDSRTVATTLAARYGLAGADGMFTEQFNRAMASNDF
jgi:clathrin heavy chain